MPEFAQLQKQAHCCHLVSPARPDRISKRPASATHPLQVQQQALGNQAVQQMLRSGAIQAKLTVNPAGDKYEQEADRVAEQVMRMPEPKVQRQVEPEEEEEEKILTKPLADQITPLVQRQVEPEEEEEPVQAKRDELQRQEAPEEEEEPILTKRGGGHLSQVGPGLEAQIRSMKGGGRPMSRSERAFFEPRFGYDFGKVQIHNNFQTAKIVDALNAHAFTFGSNLAFGRGQFKPETIVGQLLLAHELTHFIQQNNPNIRTLEPGRSELDSNVGIALQNETEPKIQRRVVRPPTMRTTIRFRLLPPPPGRWGLSPWQRRPPRLPPPSELPGGWRWERTRGEMLERKQREVQKEVEAWAQGKRPTKEGLILKLLAEMLGWAKDLQDWENSLLKEADELEKKLTWPEAIKQLKLLKLLVMNAVGRAWLRWRVIREITHIGKKGFWYLQNKKYLENTISLTRIAERRMLDLAIFIDSWERPPWKQLKHPTISQG